MLEVIYIHTFHYDIRKYSFSARIVNTWNRVTVCLFKARFDKFWTHQDVKYDFTADLTGIGDRSISTRSEWIVVFDSD